MLGVDRNRTGNAYLLQKLRLLRSAHMATDVKLDEVDGTFLVLEARVVKAEASDFMLD